MIRNLKRILLTFPIVSTAIELGYVTDVTELGFYQFAHTGQASPTAQTEKGNVSLVMLNLLIALVLHARIELDHLAFEEESGLIFRLKQCFSQNRLTEDNAYHMSYR